MSEESLGALAEEWNPQRWYRTTEIATKLKLTKSTVLGWHYPGLNIRGQLLNLCMVHRARGFEAKGEWIISFMCRKAELKDPAA